MGNTGDMVQPAVTRQPDLMLLGRGLSRAEKSISFTAEHIRMTCSTSQPSAVRFWMISSRNRALTKYRLSSTRSISKRGSVSTRCRLIFRKCWVPGTSPTSATWGREVLYRCSMIDSRTPAESPISTPRHRVSRIVATTAAKIGFGINPKPGRQQCPPGPVNVPFRDPFTGCYYVL